MCIWISWRFVKMLILIKLWGSLKLHISFFCKKTSVLLSHFTSLWLHTYASSLYTTKTLPIRASEKYSVPFPDPIDSRRCQTWMLNGSRPYVACKVFLFRVWKWCFSYYSLCLSPWQLNFTFLTCSQVMLYCWQRPDFK